MREEQETLNVRERWILTLVHFHTSRYDAFDEFITSGLANEFERRVSALLRAC